MNRYPIVNFSVNSKIEKAPNLGLFSGAGDGSRTHNYYVSGVNPIAKNCKISTLFELGVNWVYIKFKVDCELLCEQNCEQSLLHKLSQDSGIYIWLHNL